MGKVRDLASDAVLMDLLFDVTIYIYVGTVLGKQRPNSDLKNMSNEAAQNGHFDERFDNHRK